MWKKHGVHTKESTSDQKSELWKKQKKNLEGYVRKSLQTGRHKIQYHRISKIKLWKKMKDWSRNSKIICHVPGENKEKGKERTFPTK